MISGFYITAIDYVVDKGKFEDTFAGRDELSGGNKTRKLNYSMISGWTNPNTDGWVIYEKTYDDGYVAHEGESYLIDTTSVPEGGQIMIQIGDDDAIIRKQQGYYSYYITEDKGIEKIEEYAKGVFKFDLREGATIKAGDKLRVFMPYTKEHKDPVNFLEINNATKRNEGAATLTLNKDRNITVHMFKEGKKGHFVLKYTLADGTESSMEFTPKGLWNFSDKDRILTGIPNRATDGAGGNVYLNTKKLKPGADIIVESYDENGTKLEDQTSWFKYRPLTKAQDTVKELTWTDSSDKSSILSINKSLYTPYQVLFTNDYADGTDDFYKEPRVLPADNAKFNTDTTSFVGYTKYDGGKVRTLYEEGKAGKLYAKVEADENEYDDKGNLKGEDVSKKITIPKNNIFDPHFAGNDKQYTAYEYKVDLTKMLPYHSEDKGEKTLELKKDMKFVSTASDGSSLPSDLYETRVRARVLFDTTEGKFADNTKKAVKIVPDNIKFYGEDGYAANGFEGANVEANTGDKFPEAPTLAGKNFLGWVTEAGKTKLKNKTTVTADEFNALTKDEIFNADTPVEKHLVVYAIYSEETAVTFDANGGKFTDGKEQNTVKAADGTVTAPAAPAKEGYTFKGWADKKDATEADANILNNVNAPKTVYAVWEKNDKDPLTLNDPTPVEVKNTKSLTSDEIDKVKKAVADANKDKGITEADVTVAEDGTVTVTKDGKTGTLEPAKTVKQKEVQNNFNPPKEPVKVDNAKALTDTEKQAVREAIKEANPDRNFKDDEITVKPDGTVEINQGGKVGSFTPDQTVVQKDTILDLTAPEKTEVKDTTNLTQSERDKVAAAVKEANKTKLSNDAVVTVDNKGNVTVTDGTKTGKLEGKDTVKAFTRDGKKLNPPAEKVKVGDTNKLTEAEKQAVRDEVKKANPDLGFTDDEIQVDDNGTVTVPITDSKNGTFQPDQTIEAATETDNTIKLVAPKKTPVQNLDQLTAEEKEAVKKAVKEANKDLPETAKIEVAEDGSVVVTDGDKTGTLSQKDTVKDDTTKLTLAKPRPVKVKKPEKLTAEEQKAVKDAVKAVNPTLTDDQIQVDEKGNVTVTVKETVNDQEVIKTAKLGPEDTIEKDDTLNAPEKPVEVKDPSKLTEDEKKAVEDAVKKANKDLPADAKVTVGEDGSVTVTDKDGNEIGKLKPEETVKAALKAPEKPVEVKDPSKLTEDEKKAVEDAVKKANPDLPKDATIEVGNDGTVTVTGKDGKVIGSLTPAQTVKQGESKKGNNGGFWFGPFGPSADSKTDTKEQHETAIHKLYIYGYEDGTFKPEGNMTRAEAAAIIGRLQGLDLSNSARPNFIDVRSGWYNGSINAVVNAGYMKGYPDGTFRPNGKITRAEFAQMIKAIDKANTGMAPFADVKGHWAEAAINQAYTNGRIAGYPDSTFRPNNNITRAEAVTVFNKLYDRSVNMKGSSDVVADIVPFKDVAKNHWAYYEILEASNTHEFYRTEKGKVAETWVGLNQTWKQALENR